MDELANIYGRYLSQGSRVLAVGCLNDPQAQTLAIQRLASLPLPASENEKNRLPQTLLNSPHWPLAEVVLIPNLNQVGRLNTLPELLQEIAIGNKQLLFSWNFPPMDHPALQREFASLADFLAKYGLLVQASQQLSSGLLIKAVAITWPQSLPLKKVAILSYGNINNFGDRLGLHLISRLLPAHAVTKHLFFSPLEVSDETFDLLILGIGNSLFRQVLTPHLLELMNRCQQTVGIFGTQYRSEIDTT
ncbi:MAG: hypothetical protein HQL55_18380, partial [Magnetococcales bacterium]|nr:hypothetical protein [Magnetococcales bacterium]